MTLEISEITQSNQPSTENMLAHILTDLHDALQELRRQGVLLDKHDALLEQFRPLIDQYRAPMATYLSARAAAKAERRRNGGTG